MFFWVAFLSFTPLCLYRTTHHKLFRSDLKSARIDVVISSKLQKPLHLNANEIISAIKAGTPGIIENLYDLYRAEFLSWAGRKFIATPGDIEDGWQDAIIAFYEKVLFGEMPELHCSLKTFLFAIGNKKLLKNHRVQERFNFKDDEYFGALDMAELAGFETEHPWEAEREKLQVAMQQISSRCRELLVERYYHGRSIAELMNIFEYASENVVSVSLTNCMKKLKEFCHKI